MAWLLAGGIAYYLYVKPVQARDDEQRVRGVCGVLAPAGQGGMAARRWCAGPLEIVVHSLFPLCPGPRPASIMQSINRPSIEASTSACPPCCSECVTRPSSGRRTRRLRQVEATGSKAPPAWSRGPSSTARHARSRLCC